jgi:hypothetical protein
MDNIVYIIVLVTMLSKLGDPDELYQEWLNGMSTRALGRKYGVNHSSVIKYLSRHKGAECKTRNTTSLAKAIIKDYGKQDKAFVDRLLTVEGIYYSDKTLDGYSRNYKELSDAMVEPISEPCTELSLPYLIVILNTVVYVLQLMGSTDV